MNSQTYYVILSHYDGYVISTHPNLNSLAEALDAYMYEDEVSGLTEGSDKYRNQEGSFYDVYKCKSYLPTAQIDLDEWYSQTTDREKLSVKDILDN